MTLPEITPLVMIQHVVESKRWWRDSIERTEFKPYRRRAWPEGASIIGVFGETSLNVVGYPIQFTAITHIARSFALTIEDLFASDWEFA